VGTRPIRRRRVTRPGRPPAYSAGETGTYVVQSGETLSGIALQLGTTAEDLAAANGIVNPDLVYAGQTLYY
jgi:LysM repeat protein